MSLDELRTARLLFAPELADGTTSAQALERPEVTSLVRARPVPSLTVRVLQRLAMKAGRLTYESACVDPLMAARSAVLGDRAQGPPRLLIRVDEFPHYRALDGSTRHSAMQFDRFHSIMARAGVPYLLATLPRLAWAPLDPHASGGRALTGPERRILRRLAAEGVSFGLHGLDHRTRHRRAQRRSELAGLDEPALEALLGPGEAALAELEIRPRVFIAPYNRFDASQYPQLGRRFAVVCGGPESVMKLGFHVTPSWRAGAVYLPSYPPCYGTARQLGAAVERLIARGAALWVPLVLHWAAEADDGWTGLRRLAQRIAAYARPWDEFLQVVEESR